MWRDFLGEFQWNMGEIFGEVVVRLTTGSEEGILIALKINFNKN